MRWILATVFLIASSFYLYWQYDIASTPVHLPTMPPVLERSQPSSFLSAEEIRSVRGSASHPDAGIRWTAMVLLYTMNDPESVDILHKAVAEDFDPDIRFKAVQLLKSQGDRAALIGLIKGLKDNDKGIRIASLRAIGDIGDPAASPWVTEALKDFEPEVKMEALQTLGRFQDKRKQQFVALAGQLRAQYEAAVKKAQQNQ